MIYNNELKENGMNLNQKNSKVYALYTYITMEMDSKCGATPNTYSSFYPNLYIKRNAMNHIITYAIKRFFNIDIQEPSPMKFSSEGMIEGIYFSIANCGRVLAVSVSEEPTGINIQIPYSLYDEPGYVEHNFCDNEIKEYQKMNYGLETYFFMLGQKTAYRKKCHLLYDELKSIDSTKEEYTFYKDTFFKETAIFIVTGQAEFIKIDINEILKKIGRKSLFDIDYLFYLMKKVFIPKAI